MGVSVYMTNQYMENFGQRHKRRLYHQFIGRYRPVHTYDIKFIVGIFHNFKLLACEE